MSGCCTSCLLPLLHAAAAPVWAVQRPPLPALPLLPFQPAGVLSWYWHGSPHPTKPHPAPPRCNAWPTSASPSSCPPWHPAQPLLPAPHSLPRSYVWLNQYQSQFLPILGLLGLRMVVGAGEWLLRKVGKEKKSEQASGAAAVVGAAARMHHALLWVWGLL